MNAPPIAKTSPTTTPKAPVVIPKDEPNFVNIDAIPEILPFNNAELLLIFFIDFAILLNKVVIPIKLASFVIILYKLINPNPIPKVVQIFPC